MYSIDKYLRVKEDFWSEKALVSNVNRERLLSNTVLAVELLDPLTGFRVVLREFFGDVRAHIRVTFLRQVINAIPRT
jgi:hypothetical protein